MKRIVMLTLLIISIIISGCSQNSPAGQSAEANANSESKSNFPQKPIEMIIPYNAGSSTDLIARILANGVSKHLPNGQSVVVVNKAGGSGTIAVTDIFRAKPDGYKIGLISVTHLGIQPHLEQSIYSHDSFQTLVRTNVIPSFLIVKSDSPWNTFEEWLDYAKKNPGKFTYATVGPGSSVHISMEALSTAEGIKTSPVAFEGAGQSLNAVLGGHVLGGNLLPQTSKAPLEAGQVRALVNFGTVKSGVFKDVPTLQEKGIDVALDIYNGLIAPKGLPKDILDIYDAAFKKTLEDPEIIEQLKKLDIEPSYAGPDEFQKDITDSFNQIGDTLKKIGMVK
ncbi:MULTISPECIES: tripartite tricarboxylate transporter substrate binding protein [unclassified Paenibacillus]|uniref:tripartite tricarboxylate transporter substrate binding protein n=1 Tax=unclassified Paenibacillus TaxID=185978 RepID=UPI001AE94B8C|nr:MULTISPECIES: tripartite tricarboxylate transporter substrate binding protein [unclassified Paenibacillus]MBP1154472.1 tripartite-type tricarboxylate transporter receptor subunit TctC [Paenibacillus sp. PvP091]MBP1170144.1 tripartite-type tricarboxylate transporter receptor subunit TctC [Paenibacillus sp. PvR098]MBP2441172.1 tripartite-type tricarboxylate transporter receptor subunit TctC [Paenibacillus sp. PvP052]